VVIYENLVAHKSEMVSTQTSPERMVDSCIIMLGPSTGPDGSRSISTTNYPVLPSPLYSQDSKIRACCFETLKKELLCHESSGEPRNHRAWTILTSLTAVNCMKSRSDVQHTTPHYTLYILDSVYMAVYWVNLP
jgi:hypothetical protein